MLVILLIETKVLRRLGDFAEGGQGCVWKIVM